MLSHDGKLIRNPKVITCIVPVGVGRDLVESLHREHALNTTNVIRGRGASQRSGAFADEMDIFTVIVDSDRADEIFRYLYDKAEIGTAPHRLMYQSPVSVSTIFGLPEAVEEED